MNNPKQIVAQGYDCITQSYLQLVESMGSEIRTKYLNVLINYLPARAQVLELGCGAGIPMTHFLANHFEVTGVDISTKQLLLARQNVKNATFIQADIAKVNFADSTFDAVVAFYSMTHVPRSEHVELLKNIYRMLRPNGLLVATMGFGDSPDIVEQDWLGAPMFFSHFDGHTNTELVQQAGFKIISAEDETEWEYGKPVCFRWIVACKPS